MTIEACVVVGFEQKALHWHLPAGRSSVGIPDSRELWDVLWNNRAQLLGVAHSHPGGSVQGPSHEDVTTFAGVEQGLGRRLLWWIVSEDAVSIIRWEGPEKYDYVVKEVQDEPWWVCRLRQESGWKKEGTS